MNLDPTFLLTTFLTSCIGFAYFRFGKKQSYVMWMVCGIALMIMPYLITALPAIVGASLVAMILPFVIKF